MATWKNGAPKIYLQLHVLQAKYFIYVDRDVTITGTEKKTGGYTRKGFTLHFKKGWNEFYEETLWYLPEYDEVVTLSNQPFAATYY